MGETEAGIGSLFQKCLLSAYHVQGTPQAREITRNMKETNLCGPKLPPPRPNDLASVWLRQPHVGAPLPAWGPPGARGGGWGSSLRRLLGPHSAGVSKAFPPRALGRSRRARARVPRRQPALVRARRCRRGAREAQAEAGGARAAGLPEDVEGVGPGALPRLDHPGGPPATLSGALRRVSTKFAAIFTPFLRSSDHAQRRVFSNYRKQALNRFLV